MEIELTRTLPVNLEEKHAEFFRHSARFLVRPARILKIKAAFVFWNGVIFKNGKVVLESVASPVFEKKYSSRFLLVCMLKSVVKGNFRFLKKKNYLVIHDEWSSNYFHWLTNSLIRLYLAKDLLVDCILILPDSYHHSYHTYTLTTFGIKDIEWTNEKKVLFAGKVLLPLHSESASDFNPELLQQAVNYLLRDYRTAVGMGEKIYISRRHALVRKVLNEDALIIFLQNQGFTILYAETCTFEEQVSIFRQAKILISIHGAGLTNLIFMPPGSCVLEFRNEKNSSEANNCYFNLAAVFQQRYFYQACEVDSDLTEQEANMYVNLDTLRQNIKLMD